MTKAQVLLSWGKPVHKIEDGAAWIYDNKKLNFNGDILQSIELLTDGATQ
jgi:hypothetical protein